MVRHPWTSSSTGESFGPSGLRGKSATRAGNPCGLPTQEPNYQPVSKEVLDLTEKVIEPQLGSLEKGK